jgi:2-desacetyl-2-hydroxyethyl bacteriochlorophyllide A dehydrogenase
VVEIPAERIAFVGPRRVAIEPFVLPAPGPRQVLVRATRTLVSAGTEMKAYIGEDVVQRDPPYPRYPGYSHVGVIEQTGTAVTEVRVGDRVGTQKTHASRVLVDLDEEWLQVIPEGVTDDQATFAVLGSVAMHGLRKAGVRLDETCAVAGQGVVGQLAAQLAKLSGARPVMALDPVAERRASSRESGTDAQLDPAAPDVEDAVRTLTGGRGVDVTLDCTSTSAGFGLLLRLAASEGRLVVVGSHTGEARFSLFTEVQLKELSIVGAFQPLAPRRPHPALPWTQAANRKAVLEDIGAGRLRVDHLISHRAPAADAAALFRLMATGHRDWLGVIFVWD